MWCACAPKTPVQDAEDLIAASSKLTYRRAAGIVASNQIAALLIRLSKVENGRDDDITTLHATLKNKAKNPKLGPSSRAAIGGSRTRQDPQQVRARQRGRATRRRSSSPSSWLGCFSGLFRWIKLGSLLARTRRALCDPEVVYPVVYPGPPIATARSASTESPRKSRENFYRQNQSNAAFLRRLGHSRPRRFVPASHDVGNNLSQTFLSA